MTCAARRGGIVVALGAGPDRRGGRRHRALQARRDLGGRPGSTLAVLDPLVVAHDDAAGVAQDVREDDRRRCAARIGSASGVVGPLAASATIRARTVCAFAPVIWPSRAARTRTSTSSANSSALSIGSGARGHRRSSRSPPGIGAGTDVQPGVVADAATDVGHGDDPGAALGHQPGRRLADVAEALDRDARAVERIEPRPGGRVGDDVDDALTGRVAAADGAAEVDRLAGHDRRARRRRWTASASMNQAIVRAFVPTSGCGDVEVRRR